MTFIPGRHGDNGRAQRAQSPSRTGLQWGFGGPVIQTTLHDGSGKAGAEICLTRSKLLVGGSDLAGSGKVYSIGRVGYAYSLEYDLGRITGVTSISNPLSLIAWQSGGEPEYVLAVTPEACVNVPSFEPSSGTYNSSGFGAYVTVASEGQAFGAAAFVPLTRNYSPPQSGGLYFIAETATGSVLSASHSSALAQVIYQGHGTAGTLPIGTHPSAMCVDAEDHLWVATSNFSTYDSFNGISRYYVDPANGNITEVMQIKTNNVVDMTCDGKFVWVISSYGSEGDLAQFDLDGNQISNRVLPGLSGFNGGSSQVTTDSKIRFDGERLWITRTNYVSSHDPETGETIGWFFVNGTTQFRGIACDGPNRTYVAAMDSSVGLLNIYTRLSPDGDDEALHEGTIRAVTGGTNYPSERVIVAYPGRGSSTVRTFEMDVIAVESSGYIASWKPRFTVGYVGGHSPSANIVGSVINLAPVQANNLSGVEADGLDCVVSTSGGNVYVTLTSGASQVQWTVHLKVLSMGGVY